jgi:hypothetical protein
VPIRMPAALAPPAEEKTDSSRNGKAPGGGAAQQDDGELGGMGLGMEVWDDYERELKVWEASERELKVWEASEAVQETDASGSGPSGGSPVAGTS